VLRVLQELKRAQRREEIVRSIAESPYLLAAAHRSTVGFAPYENLGNATPDAPLYACAVGLLWCRRVGRVVALLPGEVSLKHPVQNTIVRGQSLQLELTDARAAEKKTLFVGRRPLLF
jgi:hypothetical protein